MHPQSHEGLWGPAMTASGHGPGVGPDPSDFDSAPDIRGALKAMCQACGHSPGVHGVDRTGPCIVGTDPRGKRDRCPCRAFVSWASLWAEREVLQPTGVTTFFGIDKSYEVPRREALERIFDGGVVHFVVYPHYPPSYDVSVYACRGTDAQDEEMVCVGTAWRDDRLPDLLEILLAFKAWGPTKDLECRASWSTR